MIEFINNIPRKARAAVSVFWAFFIAFMTHAPNPPGASAMTFDYADKIAHFSMYFIFAVLLYSAFANKSFGLNVIIIVFFLCAAYGALDEFTQRYAEGRNPDFFDWLADSAGSLASLGVVALVGKSTSLS